MHLRDHFKTLSSEEREALAAKVRVSVGHLRNACYGAPISPFVIQRIEVHTGGVVTRKAHFPDTYLEHWPEMAQAEKPSIVANAAPLGAAGGLGA